MSRATTLTLVTFLSAGQEDASAVGRFYDEIVNELGRSRWFVNATLLAPTASTATYTVPTTVLDLLGMFYGGRELFKAELRELEYVNPLWRDEKGEPVAYVFEGETTRTFRLYPIPDRASISGPPAPEPLGRDYPEDYVLMLHAETRANAPDWLDLPIALGIVAREFGRESDHQHPTLAKAAGELGAVLLAMAQPGG